MTGLFLWMTILFGFGRFFVWVVEFRLVALRVIFVDAGVDGDGRIWHWRVQELPGFFVFLQAHFPGLAVGIEAEHGLRSADFDRDDVPDVERDDVGGDEIDIAFGVDGAAFADGVGGAGFVGVGAEAVGALDLDAKKFDPSASLRAGFRLRAVVEDEVVALAVSPGFGDGEAALAGLIEEGGFGTLSGALGVGAVGIVGLARVETTVAHWNS